ncbi:hypothetical protein SAMD00023353_5400280 [Rosellinia necatrix]|uniref:Uncharacterized protein n=1 Tax=Rosellinia necatrix TaxID=77044 RepID=A0A1S8A9Y9_ROSNE|nr:hypothetical protein SAMD00023353_5400280 [Rosellinia necatrix]
MFLFVQVPTNELEARDVARGWVPSNPSIIDGSPSKRQQSIPDPGIRTPYGAAWTTALCVSVS